MYVRRASGKAVLLTPSLAACFRGERLKVGQSEQDRKIPVTQLVNLANPGLGSTREAYAQGD